MKSLFGRLLAVNFAVLLVGFVLLAAGLNTALENYFVNRQTQELIHQAQNFQSTFDDAYQSGILDTDDLSTELDNLERYLGATVWLVNSNGAVFVSPRFKDYQKVTGELNSSEVQKVFAGETVQRQGTIKAVSKDPVLTVGYPVRHNGVVVLALFTHVSIPEINRVSQDVARISSMAMGVTMLLASAIVFLMSRAMTRDIRNLNRAVRVVAEGNLEYRIESGRSDELGELAQGFNHMAQGLGRIEEMRRRFISDLSHDLRSPLTSIIGYTRGLQDGTIPSERQERTLQIISDESRRLLKLANDILDLSKIQSGELTLNRCNFDLHQMLLQTAETFETRIEQKHVSVHFDLSSEVSRVYGDPEQLARVATNLIDNAVKFVDENGAIEIRTERKEDRLWTSIRNTGVVIGDEELPQIWDRFSKLDASRGTERESSGLGLAIVREILKGHGETIEVFSNEDIGVRILFSLALERKMD